MARRVVVVHDGKRVAVRDESPRRSVEWRGVGSKHPGFKAVQHQIAKREGISEDEAGAELAARTRNASPAAKKKNPNLKRVK